MYSSEINNLFIKACSVGHLPSVMELYESFYVRPNSIFRKFASFFFISDYPTRILNPHSSQNHAFLEACYQGHNNVLCYLLEQRKFVKKIMQTDALADGFSISLKIGNLKMANLLLFFLSDNPKKIHDFYDHLVDGFAYCCENGKEKSVNYVLTNLSSTISSIKVNSSEYGASLASHGFIKACSAGKINVLKSYEKHPTILNSTSVIGGIAYAIESNQIETVKYIFNNNTLRKHIFLDKMIKTTVSSVEMMHYLMYEANLKNNKKFMSKLKHDFPLNLAEKIQVNNELNEELANNTNVKKEKKMKL